MPDLKNIKSKIGSTENLKYQPGGGKVILSCIIFNWKKKLNKFLKTKPDGLDAFIVKLKDSETVKL